MDDSNNRWQQLAAEFLGTAFLVFVGVGSIPAAKILNGGTFTYVDLGFVSLAFGLICTVGVYAFGYVSGCHINPAVTVAMAVEGKFPWRRVPEYIIAQCLGAVVGSFSIVGVIGMDKFDDLGGSLGAAAFHSGVTAPQAFFAEFVGTFILVYAVLAVCYRKATPGWVGLVVGAAVFCAILPVAPATDASINPARTFGPMLATQILGGKVAWEQLPVYVGAELFAGVVAAVAFKAISYTKDDKKDSSKEMA
jgi:glycerol uptake facilitator protein